MGRNTLKRHSERLKELKTWCCTWGRLMHSQNPVLAAAVCYCPCEHQSQQRQGASLLISALLQPAAHQELSFQQPQDRLGLMLVSLHILCCHGSQQEPGEVFVQGPLCCQDPKSSSGCWMATSNSSTPHCNWFHCWGTASSLHCVPQANTSFKLQNFTAKMTSSNGFSWLFSVSDLAL